MERLTRILAALTRWGLGLCALLLVLMALYVSLGRELTPLVAEYRARIEDKARLRWACRCRLASWKATGAASRRTAGPRCDGRRGCQRLAPGSGAVVPDLWASLLAREVRLAHLELSGLKISVKEDKDGQWALEGLPAERSAARPGATAQALQMVQQLSVLDSQVTLQPWIMLR
jgi:uncharacterized protein YhdP